MAIRQAESLPTTLQQIPAALAHRAAEEFQKLAADVFRYRLGRFENGSFLGGSRNRLSF
jgi:hypothetical protein